MVFKEENRAAFEEIFRESQPKIRAFEGCGHVELWRDIDQPGTYFTHSHWNDAAALENYRHSELFRSTWAKTKVLFDAKPEAWSVEKI